MRARSRSGLAVQLAWLAVAVGLALRVARYLRGGSLWLDESYLALNVVNRSWTGLLGTLGWSQGAPPGFLLLERAAVEAFGPGELALRLVPLLAGVACLPLTLVAARRLLAPAAVPLAVAMVAVADPLVRYSAEVKQYSLDAAVTLALLAVAAPALRRAAPALSPRRALGLAAAGAAAVWLSHPAAFVLAGIGAGLVVQALRRAAAGAEATRGAAGARALRLPAAVAVIWTASFGAFYLLLFDRLDDLRAAQRIDPATSAGHAPLPPASAADLRWYPSAGSDLLSAAFGVPGWVAAAGALAAAAGVATLWRRAPATLAALGVPLLAALGASAAGAYSFTGRMLLFAVPLVLLAAAEGSARALAAARGRALVAAAAVAVAAVAVPAGLAAHRVVEPRATEDIRPLIERLHGEARPGDALYLVKPAQYAYRYYVLDGGLDGKPPWRVAPTDGSAPGAPALASRDRRVVVGTAKPTERRPHAWVGELAPLRGESRVWLLLSHLPAHDDEPWAAVRESLAAIGKERAAWTGDGAALFLYDLDHAGASRAARGTAAAGP